MSFEVYLSFVLSASILILLPGPTSLTIISKAISHGRKKAGLTIFGASLAHLTFICVISFGINQILLWSIKYFIIIKWMGVLYLLYLGIRKFYVSPQESMPQARKQKNFILVGFLVTVTNPKTLLFYGAFFPPFLNLLAPLPSQYITLGTTFICLFIFYSFIFASFSSTLTNVFTSKRASMKIQRISGACLIAAAVLLASIKRLAK